MHPFIVYVAILLLNWASAHTSRAAPSARALTAEEDLRVLLESGQVEARVVGDDIQSVTLEARIPPSSARDKGLSTRIHPGTWLKAEQDDRMDMLVVAPTVIYISKSWVTVRLSAVSASTTGKIPNLLTTFRIDTKVSTKGMLHRLLESMQGSFNGIGTKQAAVWIVACNADRDEIKQLRYVLRQSPVIGSESIMKALDLCREAGIELRGRRIWADRFGLARASDRPAEEVSWLTQVETAWEAVVWADADVLLQLIKSGVSVQRVGPDQTTPLQAALERGDMTSARALLSHGAKVTERALEAAVKQGDTDAVRLLLGHGAVPTRKQLSDSIGRIDSSLALVLLDHGTEARSDDLHRAARLGKKQLVTRLLELGVGVNPDRGRGPLAGAAENGHVDLVSMLIAHGAEVNGRRSLTPLIFAAREGHLEVVHALLEAGADPNLNQGGTDPPLFWALWGGHSEIAQSLLVAGADPEREDSKGRSPLESAVLKGLEPALVALADAGVDMNRPREYAIADVAAYHSPTLIAPLRSLGARLTLHAAARLGDTDAVTQLLGEGNEPNKPSIAERTPVHFAILGTSAEALRVLLEAGAGVEHADQYGWTPLAMSAALDWVAGVEMLARAGSEIDHPADFNETSRTPLQLAAINGALNVVPVLIELGADWEIGRGTPDSLRSLTTAQLKKTEDPDAQSRLQAMLNLLSDLDG